MNWLEMEAQLKAPFTLEDTKWRVMNMNQQKTRGSCAYYIDSRNVMDRLDSVFGQGWSADYKLLDLRQPTKDMPGLWVVECSIHANYPNDGESRGADDYWGSHIHVSRTDVGDGEDAKSPTPMRSSVPLSSSECFAMAMSYRFVWYELNENKQFTPESEKAIKDRLARMISTVSTPPPPIKVQARQEPPPEEDFMPDPPLDEDMWTPTPPPVATPKPQRKQSNAVADPTRVSLSEIFTGSDMLEGKPLAEVQYLLEKDLSSDGPMSEKQYSYMSSLLDARYDEVLGAPAHRYVLAAIFGKAIDKDNRPGWKAKELLDWLVKPEDNPTKILYLNEVVEGLQAYLEGE